MKTIKQLREEYDNKTLVQNVPDELMLEGRESVIKSSDKAAPSPANMPAMLLFRRVAYRSYPGKQTVALYYSRIVNKYLSVPFGPDGNLNLSEAVVLDTIEEGIVGDTVKGGLKGAAHGFVRGAFMGAAIAPPVGTVVGALGNAARLGYKGAKSAYQKSKEKEQGQNKMNEDWSNSKYKNPEGGLTKAGVMAYRREHPGSKLQTAVTTKPSKLKPGSKAANRRKSFCASMGGMKERLTSAKTARDPDSRINKALRKWNCEESFKAKLAEKRQLQENPALLGALRTAGPAIVKNIKKIPGATAVGDAIASTGKRLFNKVAGKSPKITPKPRKAPPSKQPGKQPGKQTPDIDVDALANALTNKSSGDQKSPFDGAITPHKADLLSAKREPQMTSTYKMAPHDANPTFTSRYRQSLTSSKTVNENKISDIRTMVEMNNDKHDMSINGRTITINTSMAKRILEVYDSVNTKNKKIVESMLNEDLESFKKLLNFSIKA